MNADRFPNDARTHGAMPLSRFGAPRRGLSPAMALAVALVVAIGLALAPANWSIEIRGRIAACLRPGQVVTSAAGRQVSALVVGVRPYFHSASQQAQTQAELEQLRSENDRLVAELAAARKMAARPDKPASGGQTPEPLLQAGCIEARVLGQQALAFLGRRAIVDVGRQADVQVDALVVAPRRPAVIDSGQDGRLRPGLLVLSDARVWGKIVEVGPYTSVVRTVTEAGYRDLVRLARPDAVPEAIGRGPQGILEGTGQPQARVRLVNATEPVSVGDLVYTAAEEGVLTEPLLCGRVVEAERPVGAPHWEIRMEPAVAGGSPQRVAVLRTEFNPGRVAEKSEKY